MLILMCAFIVLVLFFSFSFFYCQVDFDVDHVHRCELVNLYGIQRCTRVIIINYRKMITLRPAETLYIVYLFILPQWNASPTSETL